MVEAKIKKHIKTNFIIYGDNMDYNVLIVERPFDIEEELDRVNNELESYMKIKKVIKLRESEMSKFLTPKMSIKRKLVIKYVRDNYMI
jgi:hypothetical protein